MGVKVSTYDGDEWWLISCEVRNKIEKYRNLVRNITMTNYAYH